MSSASLRRALLGLAAGSLAGALLAVPTVAGGTVPQAAPVAKPGDARSSGSSFAVQPIDWGRCKGDRFLTESGGKCGTLVVPLDHANPSGPTIELAVSRVKHTKGPGKGAVFTNPGGPGGSGTVLAAFGQFVPDGQGLRYDWYGMDPRGVGASRPALSCDGRYFGWNRPSYVPTTRKLEKYWRAKTEGYAEDCGDASAAELLDHVRTVDNVADFEILRQAIGVEQVTFYGFSYGTYIAQVYATQHPDRVKAMILDGVVDADRVWYPANLDQDRAFEKTLAKFFGWVGRYPGLYGLGRGQAAVRETYERLHAQLTRSPAGGKVGPDELDDVLLGAGYYNLGWPEVATAFAALVNDDDPSGIETSYRGANPVGKGTDNGYAMYLATICTDASWPADWAAWEADMDRVHARAPFYTWANAWFNAPCRTWPAASAPAFVVDGAAYTGPVLLLNETLDAATPLSGALATRAKFPTSVLVEGVGGTTHAASLYGIACTDDTIAALLKDGSLPRRKAGDRSDKRCEPLPPPDPTAQGRFGLRRPLLGMPFF